MSKEARNFWPTFRSWWSVIGATPLTKAENKMWWPFSWRPLNASENVTRFITKLSTSPGHKWSNNLSSSNQSLDNTDGKTKDETIIPIIKCKALVDCFSSPSSKSQHPILNMWWNLPISPLTACYNGLHHGHQVLSGPNLSLSL